MISASTGVQDTNHLGIVLEPPQTNTRYVVYSSSASVLTSRNSLADISNAAYRVPTDASVDDSSVEDLFSLQLRSHPGTHLRRVASADRRDTDTWTQQRKVHDTRLNAVATSFFSHFNGTVASNYYTSDMGKDGIAQMELRTGNPRNLEQHSNTAAPEGTVFRSSGCTSLDTPGLSVPEVRPGFGSCLHEDLSESRRRAGEILTHCGTIDITGTSSIEYNTVGCCDSSQSCLVDDPVTSFGDGDGIFTKALANWTSEWVYTLVIQPYLRGTFRFQYQGKQNTACFSLASRIRRVFGAVYNPVQVTIHALRFISTLTGSGVHDNAHFLSVAIFRYLHSNGTVLAEDFMFRTFVICAMIGDKMINDTTLSTNAWSRLTRIPQVILNATEKYVLRCLEWNVVVTRSQWQDTIIHLRSSIKMGLVFDPFAYDEVSSSGAMARCLDELIELSYANDPTSALAVPQLIRCSTQWEGFDTTEWRSKDDPVVNQKPRIIGIAPGTDRDLKVGTTAKDLLDALLGPSTVLELADLARPVGTSFCGPFGAIGARFVHRVKIAGSCQSTSWFSSHR